MDAGTYQKLTNRMIVGRKVISLRVLSNGWAELPAASVFTVERKLNGYDLVSEPCATCGIRVRITKVRWYDVDLFDDPEQGAEE